MVGRRLQPPWQERFRFPQAAKMMGVPVRLIEGWHEQKMIKTAGRDTSAPGHPHLVTFLEVTRLAVTAEVQRLIGFDERSTYDPGRFRDAFRKGTPDGHLFHSPRAFDEDAFYQRPGVFDQKVRAAFRLLRDDLILFVSRGAFTEDLNVGPPVRLRDFKISAEPFLVAVGAYMAVNISRLVRGLLARR